MSMLSILLSLLGFVLLTLGTAVFVAAEFSLTALERSTVDANARHGGRRDKMVQRAHRTLSFQLSGAQIGISITTLITGYLAEPVIARLLRGPLTAVGLPERWLEGTALIVALFIATSVSMVFGELVAQYLAVAVPLRTARVVAGPQVLFSAAFTPLIHLTNGAANRVLQRFGIEPADELRSARSPQELVSLVRTSARQGSLDQTTAVLVDRSLQFGARTAEEVVARYVEDHGDWPKSIVLDVWASASMRTGGDDIAQALALLGVRPVWQPGSQRVERIEVLRVLANLLGVPGFDFETSQDVLARATNAPAGTVMQVPAEQLSNAVKAVPAATAAAGEPVVASIYQLDGLVRRSTSLQLTADARMAREGVAA